jgi:GNAT superfamily N-acetyltransferase
MSELLVIRPATEADVGEIHRLICEIADYERLRHEVEATVEGLRCELFGSARVAEVLLAESGGKLAGYALFFHNFSTFVGRKGIYLEDLFVRPAFRRQGIGQALFARLVGLAQERRCGRIEWTVLDWNRPARDFYAGLGAREMSEWILMRLNEAGIQRARETLVPKSTP